MKRKKLLSLLLTLVMTLGMISTMPLNVSAATCGMYVYNFTPDKSPTVSLELLSDFGTAPFGSFENMSTYQQVSGTLDVTDFIYVGFENVVDGHVPIVIIVPKSTADNFVTQINSGKSLKEIYVNYCRGLNKAALNSVGPYGWKMEYDGGWFFQFGGPDQMSSGNTYAIITGAIPVDDKSVSLSVSSPSTMKVGKVESNYEYEKNWVINYTMTNNASYPIYISADSSNAYLSNNPENIMNDNNRFFLEMIESAEIAYFLAPGEKFTGKAVYQTALQRNGQLYTKRVLTPDPDTGYADLKLYNVSYLASGKFPPDQSKIERTASTYFPALDYNVRELVNWDQRGKPNKITTGNFGIKQKSGIYIKSGLDVNFTGLSEAVAGASTFPLTITGTGLDKVRRVIIVPRGNARSEFRHNSPITTSAGRNYHSQDLLKSILCYTYDGSLSGINMKVNGGGMAPPSDTNGNPWRFNGKVLPASGDYTIPTRTIKSQTDKKIVIDVNLYDLVRDFRTNSSDPNVPEHMLKYILFQDDFRNSPNYLDVYLLCRDEDSKPIEARPDWSFDSPNIIGFHDPDFSIPLTGNSNGSISVNTGTSKVGGTYLALVRSNFESNKPTSPKLVVKDSINYTEGNYKALMFTGINSTITQSGNTWEMTVNDEVMVNEYLRIRPNNTNKESKITIEYVPYDYGILSDAFYIYSENCKLVADDLTLFNDFECKLTNSDRVYWYSNQFEKVNARIYSDDQNTSGRSLYYDELYNAGKQNDTWHHNAKLYNTEIKPSQMQKIVFTPLEGGVSGDIDFDLGIVSGGIKAVYPYTNNVGLRLALDDSGFLPNVLSELFNIEQAELEEIRYPIYLKDGAVPELTLGENWKADFKRSFLYFKEDAKLPSMGTDELAAKINFDSLWEEPARVGFGAYANLHSMLQVWAQVQCEQYQGQLLPNKIFFALGSELDVIGLMPPTPLVVLRKLGGGIDNLATTIAHDGWNYMPPLTVQLDTSAFIKVPVPKVPLSFGYNDGLLSLGVGQFELNARNVYLGPLAIAEQLNFQFKSDLSKGVPIFSELGIEDADLRNLSISLPQVTIKSGGTLGLAYDGRKYFDADGKEVSQVGGTYIPLFAKGSGGLSVSYYMDIALTEMIRTMKNDEEFKNKVLHASDLLKKWATGQYMDPNEMDHILISVFGDTMYKTLMSNMNALRIDGNLSGSIFIPEQVPVIGGWTMAQGNATFCVPQAPKVIITAGGSIWGDSGPKGEIKITWDMEKGGDGLGFETFSLPLGDDILDNLNNIPSDEVTVEASNLDVKSIKRNTGIMPMSTLGEPRSDDWSFTIAEGDTELIVSVDVPEKTDITMTPSGGASSVTIEAADENAWVPLYGADEHGNYIDPNSDGATPKGYRGFATLSSEQIGTPGTVWTITGTGITNVQAANVLPKEEITHESVGMPYIYFNTGWGFSFENPTPDTEYFCDIELKLQEGSNDYNADEVYLVAENQPVSEGENTINFDQNLVKKMQSGKYDTVVVKLYKTVEQPMLDENGDPITEDGNTVTFDTRELVLVKEIECNSSTYTNPLAPTGKPSSIQAPFNIGDGFVELRADSSNLDDSLGYEVRIKDAIQALDEEGNPITDEEGNPIITDLKLDYPPSEDRRIIFGAGLEHEKEYTMHARPYAIYTDTDGTTYNIYGQESDPKPFTINTPRPVSTVFEEMEFIQNPEDGAYYIKQAYLKASDGTPFDPAIPAGDNRKRISFDFSGVRKSFKYTLIEEGSNEANPITGGDESGDPNQSWGVSIWIDVTRPARYTLIIESVSEFGDTNKETFRFVVDDSAPLFIADGETATFDGETLTFNAYLEPGAKISTPSGGTWTYAEPEENDSDATSENYGTWTGTLTAPTLDEDGNVIEGGEGDYTEKIVSIALDGSEEASNVSVVYEIPLTATDFAGNETTLLLQVTKHAEDFEVELTGPQQLIIDTNYGNVLSKGMTGTKLLQSVLIAPDFTEEQTINFNQLTNVTSSDEDILSIDATGNITIKNSGTVTITGKYNELTAELTLTIVDILPIAVTITELTENSVKLSLPALPGFTGSLTIGGNGLTNQIISTGFDQPQEITFDNLTKDTNYVITLTHTCPAYDLANVYILAANPLSTEDTDAEEPNITSHPINKTIAQGDSASISVTAAVNDAGELSYQWYSNTDPLNTGGTKIEGATSESYVLPTNAIGTYYYYCIVTNTNEEATGVKTVTSISNVCTIVVSAPISISSGLTFKVGEGLYDADDNPYEGEGWSASGNTLTLTNFNFTTDDTTALYIPVDSTIILNGTNSIRSAYNGTDNTYGIWANGDLTIQGDGTLNVSGGQSTSGNNSYAIYLNGEGHDVTMNSGTINATTNNGNKSFGIYSNSVSGNNIFKMNNGTINITLGDNGSNDSYGIRAGGDLNMIGGTINIATKATSYGDNSYGVYVLKKFVMDGGKLAARGNIKPVGVGSTSGVNGIEIKANKIANLLTASEYLFLMEVTDK